LNRISATFNQAMTDGNWAFVIWDAPFPEKAGDPSYDAAKRVCGMPVKLEPGKVYMVGINIGKYNNFQSHDGVTARPYAIVFATQTADGKPTPIPQDLLDRAKQVNDAVAQYIEQSKPAAPITEAQELAIDDGKPADKMSISGGGHGVKFTCPGDRGILRAVKIYGSRYGTAEAPKEDFHVWVCDDQSKILKDFTFPYSKFVRGREKWVVLPTVAFEVPKQFVIFVGFNSEQTKGVKVYYDTESSGKSLRGLPTSQTEVFDKGDWLIRAVISGSGSGASTSAQALGKLPSLKALTAGMYAAMEKQDTQTALSLLKELIAGSESLRPMIRGNVSAEETVTTGLKILNQIREAIEQNDIPKAKGLLEALDAMGPRLEEAFTEAMKQPVKSNKADKLEAEKIRAQAWQLWNQQKFAEAEPLFQQALEKDPTNANAWNGYGWTLFNLGRPDAAKEAFTKCIELDSKQGAAWNGLGWIAKGQGKVDEAVENWEQALKVLPNGTAAMNGLAMTYMEKQDYAKAAQVYQRWLKVEPNSSDAKAGLEKAQDQISK